MLKRAVIGLIFSLITCSAFAKAHYDFVKSARVNGLEMTKEQNFKAIQSAFGKSLSPSKLNFDNQCTGNPEASLNYKNKSITMEFFPENNPKGIVLSSSNSKASIWIYWQTTTNLTDKILLDQKEINGDMHFDAFKKMYPLSARSGVADESDKSAKTYMVLLSGDPMDEEIPYRSHLEFTFKNNQLVKLYLAQGVAC